MNALICIALACLPAMATARSLQVEGTWENTRAQITLLVEITSEGIKVLRNNQSRWYYYQEIRTDQYRDQDGNTYSLIDHNTLEWESIDGEKRIRFYKGTRNGSKARIKSNSRSDVHIQRNHYYKGGKSRRFGSRTVHPRTLEGKWLNNHTGQTIRVKAKRNRLYVRAKRTGWVRFHQGYDQTFTDQYGNSYEYDHGRLTYISRNRDFKMTFHRYH